MAKFIATTQIVEAGNDVIFGGNNACCKIRHRDNTGIFTLRGSGNCCQPAVYRVDAHVVTTATAAVPITLVLVEDGEVIPDSEIALVPAAVGNVLSGQTSTEIVVDCDCAKVALRGLTAVPLTIANLIITRID